MISGDGAVAAAKIFGKCYFGVCPLLLLIPQHPEPPLHPAWPHPQLR